MGVFPIKMLLHSKLALIEIEGKNSEWASYYVTSTKTTQFNE